MFFFFLFVCRGYNPPSVSVRHFVTWYSYVVLFIFLWCCRMVCVGVWGLWVVCFCGCVFLSGFFYILCFCFVVCVLGVCFFVLLVVYFDSVVGWCCFGGVFVCLFWVLLLFLFFCCVLMCMWCVFFWVSVVFWVFWCIFIVSVGVGKTLLNQPLKNTIFYNFWTSIFSTEQLNILQSRLHYNEFFYARVFFYNMCYILFLWK